MSHAEHHDFRSIARERLGDAKRLLEGSGREIVYACLELRIALEALTFDIVQDYGDDVSSHTEKARTEWRPVEAIAQLFKHDPFAGHTLKMVLTATPLKHDGTKGDPIVTEAITRRLNPDWTKAAYAFLNVPLHHPTLKQLAERQPLSSGHLWKGAQGIAEVLEWVLASDVASPRTGIRFGGYRCPACRHELTMAVLALMSGAARTTCAGCGKSWRTEGQTEDHTPIFVPAD